jgi:hypothetical protein
MTSPRKISANRLNGRRSRGPSTRQGKAAASRNALRHGLTTINHRNPAFAPEIENLARVLCEGDSDPQPFRYALIIAECHLLLRHLEEERVAVIRRYRDVDALTVSKRSAVLAGVKSRRRQTDAALAEFEGMGTTFEEGVTVRRGHLTREVLQEPCNILLHSTEPRDDVDAFCAALPELARLDRYEQRTCSRLARAMRDFVGMKSWDDNPEQKG